MDGKVRENRLRLTGKDIASWVLRQKGKQARLWDTTCPKLFVLVTALGTASYYLRYVRPDGSKNDLRLGSIVELGPEEARLKATREMSAYHVSGIDPARARQDVKRAAAKAKENTFASLASKYLKEHTHHAQSTIDSRRSMLNRYVLPRIGGTPYEEVRRPEIKRLVADVQKTIAKDERRISQGRDGKPMANKVHEVIKQIYAWANEEELTEVNPAEFQRRFEDDSEKRIGMYNDERFRAVWLELVRRSEYSHTSLANLIFMATLQRPIDVARARREEINLNDREWIIPKHRTKRKKKPYFVPLSPVALALIERAIDRGKGEWLFPSATTSKTGHLWKNGLVVNFSHVRAHLSITQKLDTDEVQLYDGRRFGRTRIEYELGFGEKVAEQVINHYHGKEPTNRYDVHDFRQKIRAAQEAWSADIERMTGWSPE